jgi:hypothetical protein
MTRSPTPIVSVGWAAGVPAWVFLAELLWAAAGLDSPEHQAPVIELLTSRHDVVERDRTADRSTDQ